MNLQSEGTWKRNKTIAILLAVFFGPWTWLYTYRRDSGPAAAGLGLNISLLASFTFMVIQHIINPPPADLNAGEALVYSGLGLLLFLFATWISAIVVSIAAKDYYLEKPVNRVKAIAILLSIFLGPWTWLYTYSKDYWKFWPAVLIGLGGCGLWAMLPEEPSKVVHSFWLPACLVIWAAAIILTLVRRAEWFERYEG